MTNIQNTLSAMAKDLYEVGAIDKTTLRQLDPDSLPPVPQYTAKQIAHIPPCQGEEHFPTDFHLYDGEAISSLPCEGRLHGCTPSGA
ncbi:hypothetical protein [Methylovulum psychrotolerans]|uniref:Helix-turn-helix domain-containing protein n=1 Tax=Methylovulum psychrotolerans TaxID=1704499 RepID=A0A2S5CFI0_9GAMM|nr:hypothetical protein [Methylovulum psychrotolerans]POZ49559.1 helix-turn-helix domain-containing protein [Methylovulum psychrotolerans]